MILLMFWYSRVQAEGEIAHTSEELDAVIDRIGALAGAD
jgi:hypothetical protein